MQHGQKSKPLVLGRTQRRYVNHDGQRHCLGEHPAGSPKPKKGKTGWNAPKEIRDAFHKLMGAAPPPTTTDTVVAVLDDFLGRCYDNRAKRTADRYKDFIQEFVREYGRMSMSSLNAGHVTTWLNARTGWNATTKRNAITALQRGFNWAVKNRGLDRNPIKGMEKPEANRRSSVVTPDEFDVLLQHVQDEPFRDLLIVSYDCGARAQETKSLEARHVDLALQRAVLPTEEAKGKHRPRTIYFPTPRSMEIIGRLVKRHPTGPIFRNRRGNKWTGFAVKCRFEDLDDKVGRRVTQYEFRRTWITRKLIAGVDSHVVAQLSGHADTSMIDKHYSAVADAHEFMLRMAGQDVSPKKET